MFRVIMLCVMVIRVMVLRVMQASQREKAEILKC